MNCHICWIVYWTLRVEKMLGLYKRVCRKYLDIYPGCIRDYIEAYREMWEDEDSYSADFS